MQFKNVINTNKSKGFTLIELILYVALLSIFLTGAVLFSWDLIYGRVKSQTHQEVIHNARLVSKRIQFELKNASSITLASGSTLTLATSDTATNPTTIDLSGGRVRIGYGAAGSCPTSSPCFLTSDDVSVSSLTFTDLSNGNSGNVQYQFTVESTADRKEWQHSVTYQGSGEVRSL